MGLRPGREGVRGKPALRLVPQEPQGRRYALQHLPRRAEDLHDGQLDDAEICRTSRAEADAERDPAPYGRAVPQYEDPLHRRDARGAGADHAACHPLFGSLPRDGGCRGERETDHGGVRQTLFDEGLHVPGRARHADDPARFDPAPQTDHARVVRGARSPHGVCQGVCRRPQLPLFQVRHGQAGQAADRIDHQTLRLYVRHRPPGADALHDGAEPARDDRDGQRYGLVAQGSGQGRVRRRDAPAALGARPQPQQLLGVDHEAGQAARRRGRLYP